MDPLTTCFLSLQLVCFSGPELGGNLSVQAADVVTAQQPAWRPEKASSVLTQVQAFYDGTTDLQAKFSQTYWNPSYGSNTKTKGRLKLKKPGMMVWDYEGKSDADYYADGKELAMVEHDTRQVIRTDVATNNELTASMKFLFGGQKLLREFKVRYAKEDRVKKYGDKDHHVLELKPKAKNKHYKGLVLIVHATTGRVDAFVVYNTDGSSNYFQLDNIRTNAGLADKAFSFKNKKGYVETRE
jgi:outer membrane lipoprotein carrier protein